MNLRDLTWVSCALMSAGCGPSYDAPSGEEEPITVEYTQSPAGAPVSVAGQFFPGVFSPGKGPEVSSIKVQNSVAVRGGSARSLDGDATPATYAVALRLENAGTGYYIVKVNLPDASDPPNLNWLARVRFTDTAPLGEQTLLAAAIDKAGQFGPIAKQTFTIVPLISPDADTVISLVWGTRADLDLHLRSPDGRETDPKTPNTRFLDGGTPPPGNGVFDHDANANCVYDGVIREDVTFKDPPEPGLYQIRVDEFNSCGVAATTFRVEFWHKGPKGPQINENETITGQLLDINADGGGPGSGLFVGERTSF